MPLPGLRGLRAVRRAFALDVLSGHAVRVHRPVWIVIAAVAFAGCGQAAARDAASLPVSATLSPPPKTDRAGLRRERQITAMLNRAMRATIRADRRCAVPSPFEGEPTYTDAPPSPELLAAFAILRRPQTESERIPDERMRFPIGTVYRGAYRIATSDSGRQYLLVVAQNGIGSTPRPPECADAFRSHFEDELTGRGARFKREARRALRRIIRDEWSGDPDATLPLEGLYLFDYRDGRIGGGGGGGTLESLWEYAPTGSTGDRTSSIVSALVPDGVATVELTFPRVVSRGRYRPPKRYARTVAVTAPVRDNVISVRVPRPPQGAFPTRTVWKGAGGETIKVFRHRR